jgi:hypothetical protein
MKRPLRFVLMLAVALGFVPFLPLYVERTMMRSWRMDQMADIIEWGWKVCTLNTFWSDYNYLHREQEPGLWLAVNLALAFIYAVVIALSIDQFLARRKRREKAVGSRQ